VGISTCPNDTFAFHGLLTGALGASSFDLEFELEDVETLNERFLRGDFDAAKVSFAAALSVADQAWVLPAGSALGVGVGPVVLRSPRADAKDIVLAPGAHTTANLLWRIFHADERAPEQVVFSEIMPALERGDARLGVCIHEGRFTYRERGLELVEDLGARWEEATGHALPLGGIVARRDLGAATARELGARIGESIDHARAHPEAALATMRRYAQEASDAVLWKHVELYVTAETRRLSASGRAALLELARRAGAAGAVARATPLELVPEG